MTTIDATWREIATFKDALPRILIDVFDADDEIHLIFNDKTYVIIKKEKNDE